MTGRRSLATWMAFFFISITATAQQTYQGTLVAKLGGKQTGTITVNLDGPNDELIQITTSEQTKSKSKHQKTKQTETTSMKLSVALISSIIINDTTFYFRDIKYDYNEKYYRNVCVRLIAGTVNCGMFQNGRSTGLENISIKLPKEEFSKLVATEFDYYKLTAGWQMMAFKDCAGLYDKMKTNQAGYRWDDNTPAAQRIEMWRKWISEFNACKTN